MSLKGFHIVFILISTLLALGCGIYCVRVNLNAGEAVFLPGAVISFAIAFGLLVYGLWFLRKMKRLRIIT